MRKNKRRLVRTGHTGHPGTKKDPRLKLIELETYSGLPHSLVDGTDSKLIESKKFMFHKNRMKYILPRYITQYRFTHLFQSHYDFFNYLLSLSLRLF